MTLRRACWTDAWRLWRWRNHVSTRAMMRQTGRIGLATHLLWLARTLRSRFEVLYVAEVPTLYGLAAVGTGRIDFGRGVVRPSNAVSGPAGLTAEISVTVAPAWRGYRYGRQIVAWMVDEADRVGCVYCVALIRPENSASLRTFERVGFTRAAPQLALDAAGYVMMERRC